MNQIRPWLYVGNRFSTEDPDLLGRTGIGAMLQLYASVHQPGIPSIYVPIEDGYPLPSAIFTLGVGFVRAQKAQGRRVLVACGAGISRSATVAIAVLKEEEGLGLKDAFLLVREGNPRALPDQVHWQSLCQRYNEDVSFWDLWRTAEL
ncbi:MAG: dual specificity protein phosphatase [bacterium]|nr:dual specificity protein phosphatase [bacterium]